MKYLLPILVLIMVITSGCDEKDHQPDYYAKPIQVHHLSDCRTIEIYLFGMNTCYVSHDTCQSGQPTISCVRMSK